MKSLFTDKLLGGRISSTISYYDIKLTPAAIQSLVVGSVNGQSLWLDVQNGSEESKGMDMDFTFSPLDGWQIYASYSYGLPKYTSYPSNPNYVGLPAASQNNTVIKNAENLWTRYQFRHGSLKGFYIGGGAQRFGERIQNVSPQLLLDPNPNVVQNGVINDAYPPYTLLSVMAGYTWHSYGHAWTVDVTGQNLTNENYIPGLNGRAEPRRYIVTVTEKL